jgi:branched-chain amino acid transport system substrate-binding protein
MAQKKQTSTFMGLWLLTVLVLFGVPLFFLDRITHLVIGNITASSERLEQQRISTGGKILVATDATVQKKSAVEAFSEGDLATAIEQFQASLKIQPNDPESLIYLNNARVADRNPIKIAAVVPVGGNFDVAMELLRGIAQAQNEIDRAGGINGRPIEIAIANDDNNPEIAKKVAKALLADENILAVIGHGASETSLAAAPIYRQEGLVAIAPNSFAKALSEYGDYFFRTLPSTEPQAELLATYAFKKTKTPKVAICYDSKGSASRPLRQEFIATFSARGGKIVEVGCDLSSPDLNSSAIISEAISKGANGLLIASGVESVNNAIDVANANQRRLFLLGNATLYTFKTLKNGQENVNGAILPAPWHPQAFRDNLFSDRAKKLWGGEVNWRSAMAYDSTLAIIAGFKQGEISRSGLQKALSNPNFSTQGATGEIRFLPTGDRDRDYTVVEVQPGNKSGVGFDFIPLSSQ